MHAGVKRGQPGGGVLNGLGSFGARFLQLTLGDLELISHDFQVALQIGVGLFILHNAILQGSHVLFNALFQGADL